MKSTCVLALVGPFLSIAAFAGTTGLLEGTVRDAKTGEGIPAANVYIEELQTGVSTDGEGRYLLRNIRAGLYTVRFTHVGYTVYAVRQVAINPDLRTTLDARLQASDLHLSEIVVLQEKPLIQHDATGTMYLMSGQELTLLPIQDVTDVLGLKAGVTVEGNVRGGKTSEVTYLIDGLPVQDLMAGGVGTTLPASSVVGMSLYTGGFEPEYGNALSGVVNIVTRTGSDEHKFSLRADKDDLFERLGSRQISRENDVEASASGPLVEHLLFYTASGRMVTSHTRWWQDMQHFFAGPYDKRWNGFAKLDYTVTPTLRVGAQILLNRHDTREYEFPWRYNLGGLAAEHKNSNRIAAIVSHTPTDNFSYTASLSRYYIGASIGDEPRSAIPYDDPWQYDLFLRYVVSGQRALWERASQESYTGKFDGMITLERVHLVKFGVEGTLFRLTSDVVHLEPQMTFFGKPIAGAPQLDFSSSYRYSPRSGAAYVQDKIDILDRGGLITLGVRYDFLDTRAERPPVGLAPGSSGPQSATAAVAGGVKQMVNPRLGAMMQMDESSYLFVNLGWYSQFPLFDYLYSGLDRVALSKGVSAVTGNPGLEPERSRVIEISYKRTFPLQVVGSLTYFKKATTNLIDTKTFVPGDSKVSGSYGFAEFVNDPHADASGLELTISRDRGEWLTGEISYTYMVAEGTSGSAYQGFQSAQYGLPATPDVFPLSWDQRHSLKAVVNVNTPIGFDAHVVANARSGRPYTYYPTGTGFEQINSGVFAVNNRRMPGYSTVDLVCEQRFTPGWWPGAIVSVYCDIRNLLNEKNVAWMDSNGRIGGELDDPSGYFIGRRTRVGLRLAF